MRLKSLSLLVAEDCNYNCSYCYHTKEDHMMDWGTAQRAIDLFLNQLSKNKKVNIFFYGGEPLLNFDLIQQAVNYCQQFAGTANKKTSYSLTTNGSLLNSDILAFLNDFQFTLELSFDGTAQNRSRKRDTFKPTLRLINKILQYPDITLMVNSVFTSQTINHLSPSTQMILDLQVPLVNVSLSYSRRWNCQSIAKADAEYSKLTDLAMIHYKRSGKIAVVNFHAERKNGLWMCGAGQDSITVTASGEVWGCPLFYTYFKDKSGTDLFDDFYFGQLEAVMGNGGLRLNKISQNYTRFRMDHFYTSQKPCFLCKEVDQCGMCPITIAFTGASLGKIPPYACQLNRIHNRAYQRFHNEIKKKVDERNKD